ncbi:hypothetical protein NM688_g1038 [Phlebia brevispora]|uniref:Uncharacterized protein n=1 Tax=Phlebia brevispora TaxID=194682 RepID=A0ACC1TCV1_9APHY|nr:hypothetical protein NM688_g1038 [Phlebia brevispora]
MANRDRSYRPGPWRDAYAHYGSYEDYYTPSYYGERSYYRERDYYWENTSRYDDERAWRDEYRFEDDRPYQAGGYNEPSSSSSLYRTQYMVRRSQSPPREPAAMRHHEDRPVTPLPVRTPSPSYLALAEERPTPLSSPTEERKLLILDLNGTLVHRAPYTRPKSRHDPLPTDEFGRALPRLRPVHPRPYMAAFRQYLFSPDTQGWLDVMIWSSAQPHSVTDMADKAFGEDKAKLVAVWARDTLGLSSDQYSRKVQTVKDLTTPWTKLPALQQGRRATTPSEASSSGKRSRSPSPAPTPTSVHSALTTLLLDDSPAKAVLQPYNHVCLPEYSGEMRAKDLELFHSVQLREADLQADRQGSTSPQESVSSNDAEELPTEDSKKRKRKEKKEMKRAAKRAQREAAYAPAGEDTRHFDETLLAVVGVLDEIKMERNVAAWIRTGGLWGSYHTPDVTKIVEKPTIASLPTESPTIQPEEASSQGRTEEVLTASGNDAVSSPVIEPAQVGSPVKESLDENAQHLWFEHPSTLEYWATRGKAALEKLGIPVVHGIELALESLTDNHHLSCLLRAMPEVPDRSIRICADRGGTFCDVFASYPDPEKPGELKEIVVKLLSQDEANYRDAPTEGIRRVLEIATGASIPRASVLQTDKIDYIRLSTTVATNALLERKGQKHALLITKGFKDLLLIGNQSRPKIFDLNIRRPPPLYSTVVEVDERVTLVGYTSDPEAEEHAVQFDEGGDVLRGYRGKGWDGKGLAEGPGDIVRGISGEAVRIMRRPDLDATEKDLRKLYDEGYRSLAIVLCHSYTFPDHELQIGRLARKIGFTQVSESSQLLPMIKMVPRGVSSTADAYLTPILRSYLDGFFSGFDEKLKDGRIRSPRVEFMGSDGGLLDLRNFSGLKSILSGPAGGVVGYALTSWDPDRKHPVIGLDVGGTSTDVSRFDGRYEVVYETTTAGVTIQSPQLDINTVAAGGGSCLTFRNGLFLAGPESAGAEPGPSCYRKGGPLAVTDANLMLGRLIPDYFPKIFGKSAQEPLDVEASRAGFEVLAKEINATYDKNLDLDEIVYGFIKVANETMCRPIRALTEARGYALHKHILASFGGAGGQHACEIAHLLGIKTILIHRYSSILSAYGLALADRAFELQEPSSTFYTADNRPTLKQRLDRIETDVKAELKRQGFEGSHVHTERMLNMRFEGTDTALMVLPSPHDGDGNEDFEAAFKRVYKAEFGFLLETKTIIVDDVKVRGIGKTFDSLGESVFSELEKLQTRPVDRSKADTTYSVYFDRVGRVKDTPVFQFKSLHVGDKLEGPAMIIDNTQTIILIPGATAILMTKHLYITLE